MNKSNARKIPPSCYKSNHRLARIALQIHVAKQAGLGLMFLTALASGSIALLVIILKAPAGGYQ